MDENARFRLKTDIALGLGAVGFVIFGLWSKIDLAISSLFFDGGWFGTNPALSLLRNIYYYGSFLAYIWILILLLYSWWRGSEIATRIYASMAVFGALGPLFFVNSVLKAFWGRARPYLVEEFGGERLFTPAQILPVDQCESNCSFTSGEGAASAALILMALLLLGPQSKWRWLVIPLLLPMALLRVMAGKHFFSDIYFSFIFMALIFWLVLTLFRIRRDELDIAPGAWWRDSKRAFTIFLPKTSAS